MVSFLRSIFGSAKRDLVSKEIFRAIDKDNDIALVEFIQILTADQNLGTLELKKVEII